MGVAVALSGVEMNGWVKIAAIGMGCLLGLLLIMAIGEAHILCVGTAFVGSVLICHGIGMYVGGFPGLAVNADAKFTPIFIGYIAGMVVITIIGARV